MALIANGVAVQPQKTRPVIVNGDMAVAQRSTSVTGHNAVSYTTVDRFKTVAEVGTYTVIQESLTSGAAYLAGFRNALRLDCTTAEATAGSAGDQTTVEQRIEGGNLQAWRKGTSSAQPFTLAFWVKSNKTGSNLQVNLRDSDNSRQIGGTYDISVADTWEHKVINFAADTTGAFNDDNGLSLTIEWFLDGGSNYSGGAVDTTWGANDNTDRNVTNFDLAGSTDNDWAITGVQLEVGTFSSTDLPPFQFESYGENLARCQRYYYQHVNIGSSKTVGIGYYYNSSDIRTSIQFPTTMRTNPSLVEGTGTDAFYFERDNGQDYFNGWTALVRQTENTATLYVTGQSGTQGSAGTIYVDNNLGSIGFDAEI